MTYGVLLRGLPFNASIEDITSFFSTLSIRRSAVDMIHMYNGHFSGIAYVELHNREEVKVALLMDQNHIGDRYIDVMEVTEEKLDQIKKSAIGGIRRPELHRMCSSDGVENERGGGHHHQRGGRGSSRGGGRRIRERSRSPVPVRGPRTRFAYVTGFPQNTLYKGVRSFFDGCLIGPSCVHLFRGENDRFRGDGYIEFANSDELKKALKRNEDYYQGSYRITIEPCSEEEVNDMKPYMMETTRPARGGGGRSSGDEGYGGYRPREDYGGYRNEMSSMGSYRGSSRGRESSRYSDFSSNERFSTDYRHGERQFPSLEPLPSSSRHSHYSNGGGSGSRRGDDIKREYELSDRYSSQYPSSSSSSSGHYNLPSSSSGSSARDKKTLRLQGLSSSTGISDVVTFFRHYGVEYESVRIQCYDDGTPNGKAFVTFPSERIASAALHDMNRRLLKNSYVELAPVN